MNARTLALTLCAALCTAAVAAPAYADDERGAPRAASPAVDDGPTALFGARRARTISGFGAIESAYTRLAGTDTVLACVEGGAIFDRALSIGANFCGLASRMEGRGIGDAPRPEGDRLEVGYGGLAARYHFFATELANLSIGATLGGGTIVTKDASRPTASGGYEPRIDPFFVVEPRVTGYLNLTRWARLGVFGGYRVVSGSDTKGLSSRALSGPTAGVSVQLGWF